MNARMDASSADWRPYGIPGGTPEVQLTRLAVDPRGGFDVLVRFPTGWSRPGPGHYDAAEEVLFLAGSFSMSGKNYTAGDHGWFPADFTREDSVSPTGALALAWFSGGNSWTESISDRAEQAARGVATRRWTDHQAATSPIGTAGWLLREDDQRSTWIVEHVPEGAHVDGAEVGLFDLATHRWANIPPGGALPDLGPGPVWLRTVRTT